MYLQRSPKCPQQQRNDVGLNNRWQHAVMWTQRHRPARCSLNPWQTVQWTFYKFQSLNSSTCSCHPHSRSEIWNNVSSVASRHLWSDAVFEFWACQKGCGTLRHTPETECHVFFPLSHKSHQVHCKLSPVPCSFYPGKRGKIWSQQVPNDNMSQLNLVLNSFMYYDRVHIGYLWAPALMLMLVAVASPFLYHLTSASLLLSPILTWKWHQLQQRTSLGRCIVLQVKMHMLIKNLLI